MSTYAENRLKATVYGVGKVGEGPWKVSDRGVVTREYKLWSGMLARGYSPKLKEKYPTYAECTVWEGWLCFQDFMAWVDALKYKDLAWGLDKDIIVPGNKIYSPQTCALVPDEINCSFRPNCGWGKALPEGVAYIGSGNRAKRFQARIATFGGRAKSLGYFATPAEAAEVYSVAKNEYARQLGRKWAGLVDPRVVNALLAYRHIHRESEQCVSI